MVEVNLKENGLDWELEIDAVSKKTAFGKMPESVASKARARIRTVYNECRQKGVSKKSVTVKIGDGEEFSIPCCLPPEAYIVPGATQEEIIAIGKHLQDALDVDESMD
jgi:hypothetical protein